MSVDVAAIRAALAKATPGPWEWTREYEGTEYEQIIGLSGAADEDVVRGIWVYDGIPPLGVEPADADLIVLLRNNIEALLDALEVTA